MVISLRRLVSFIWFSILFALLTLFFYYILGLMQDFITPSDPYRLPAGQAVKAFNPQDESASHVSPLERLRLYYWYGE